MPDPGLLVQGPQAAQLLGDLGADVIEVELSGLGDLALRPYGRGESFVSVGSDEDPFRQLPTD